MTGDVFGAVRAAVLAAGLGPRAATRLALAASLLPGASSDDARFEIRPCGELVIEGAVGTDLPDGLVDGIAQRDGAVVVSVTTGPADGALADLYDALPAATAALADPLAAVVAAAEREAAARVASVAETEALRAELDETSRGLLAVYAELSGKSEEVEHARAHAERTADAKAAFLANMSHEIRSPLNAVIGFTILLQETELTAEQAEYTGIVRGAGDHLRGVIDDILDLSKIESGRLELESIPFDLIACVEDAVTMVAPRAEEKGLALATLVSPGTPDTVVGDPVRLRQIVVNLLANAVKFTKDGEVSVEVDLDAGAPGSRCDLRLTVRDTGIGIPEDAIARVFAPFTQASADTTRKYGGTGLGLSICRELAHRMNGGVEVASTVGVGSTFTCTVSLETAQPAVPAGPAEPGEPDLRGLRVLVEHGQPLVVEALRRQLGRWGADVVCGVRGAAAGPPFDLMLVDVHSTPAGAPASDPTATGGGGVAAVIAVAGLSDRALAHGPYMVRTPVRRGPLRAAVLGALGRRTGLDPAVSATAVSAAADRTPDLALAHLD